MGTQPTKLLIDYEDSLGEPLICHSAEISAGTAQNGDELRTWRTLRNINVPSFIFGLFYFYTLVLRIRSYNK